MSGERSSRAASSPSRWGVRRRAVAAAVTTMAIILATAGIVLMMFLRTSLLSSARDAALQQREAAVSRLYDEESEDSTANISGTSTHVTQLLDTAGRVRTSSDEAFTDPLYGGRPLAPGESYLSEEPNLLSLLEIDDHLVTAEGVSLPDGNYTVVVAVPTEVQRNAVVTVGWSLLIGIPILLALAGGLIWFLVGRALQPVERIRATVSGITRQRLDARVEVPQTRDEIQRLAATMNEMLARLESADLAQRRFVTDASHELRSPLATLTTGLEVASADATGAIWRDSADVMRGQTRRMGYLVEDLLTLAKLDDAGLRFTMTDVDLDDVLNDEVQRLRAVSTHAVTATLVPARVTGDANRLAQVFRNVLNNADRHASARVDVNLAVVGADAVVDIDNDGDTIPMGQRERIFQRFIRLDASRARESGGSGLGLAISREILGVHAGGIEALETPEGRTRFRLILPLQST